MKALATLMGIIAPATAFAASGAAEEGSGIFVWIFLGFCALIIAMQIVPAALLLFGMAKGVASVVKEGMATSKYKLRMILSQKSQKRPNFGNVTY